MEQKPDTTRILLLSTKALLTVGFSMIIYLLVLVVAVLLTALCIWFGITIILEVPSFFAWLLGIGTAGMGILILIFLLKFLFRWPKRESNLFLRIKREDEPNFFAMLDDVAKATNTRCPKRVLLSFDVNAAISYRATFWRMFLPLRRRLHIGMGLINTVSVDELRGCIAHELAHFSQKSLRVGAYVHQANRILMNLLFENASYDKMANRLARTGNVFAASVAVAQKLIEGMKWIFNSLFELINRVNFELSREMEFQADAIAAAAVGPGPIKSGLLRIPLSERAFESAIAFYQGKAEEKMGPLNIYKDQWTVLIHFCERHEIPLSDGLPYLSLKELNRFNRSKLVISDQWSSHPSTDERIRRIDQFDKQKNLPLSDRANLLFKDIVVVQQELTRRFFNIDQSVAPEELLDDENFAKEYRVFVEENSFPEIYNGYYDDRIPEAFSVEPKLSFNDSVSAKDLFSDHKVGLIHQKIALQSDIETIKRIAEGEQTLATFDYDGIRYSPKTAIELIERLNSILSQLTSQVLENDIHIFNYFLSIEVRKNLTPHLQTYYSELFEYAKNLHQDFENHGYLANSLQFVYERINLDDIHANFIELLQYESAIKVRIKSLLIDQHIWESLPPHLKEVLTKYESQTWTYFNGKSYINENLAVLFDAVAAFPLVLRSGYEAKVKRLLIYQAQLGEQENTELTGLRR